MRVRFTVISSAGRFITQLVSAGLMAIFLVFGPLAQSVSAVVIGAPCPSLFSQYDLLTANSNPRLMVAGANGDMWFTETAQNYEPYAQVAKITASGTITEYPLPDARQTGISSMIMGTDGALRLIATTDGVARIYRFAADGTMTQYPLDPGYLPYGLVNDPDGSVWFIARDPATPGNQHIGHLANNGNRTYFSVSDGLGSNIGYPTSMTWGSDGALWFTFEGSDMTYPDGTHIGDAEGIGRMSTSGSFSYFPLSNTYRSLSSITAGPDGALWFTEYRTNQIGRITVDGSITEQHIDNAAGPSGIISGPGSAVWYHDTNGTIGRFTPQASGFMTDHEQFYLPNTYNAGIRGMAFDGTGGLWVAEGNLNRVAHMASIPASPVFVPPSNVAATSGTLHPAVTWDGASGADRYLICRDGVQIATSSTTNYTDTAALRYGQHYYAVLAIDAAGNQSDQSYSAYAYVDTAPILSNLQWSANPLLQGQQTTFRVTAAGNVGTVTYTIDGGEPQQMDYDSSNDTWVASFGSDLSVNTYTIEVTAISGGGKASQPLTDVLAIYSTNSGYVAGHADMQPTSADTLPIALDTSKKPANVVIGFTNIKPTAGAPTGSFDVQYVVKNNQDEFSLSSSNIDWVVVPDATHASILGRGTLIIYSNGTESVHTNVTVRFDVTLSSGGTADHITMKIYDTGVSTTNSPTWMLSGDATSSSLKIKP